MRDISCVHNFSLYIFLNANACGGAYFLCYLA